MEIVMFNVSINGNQVTVSLENNPSFWVDLEVGYPPRNSAFLDTPEMTDTLAEMLEYANQIEKWINKPAHQRVMVESETRLIAENGDNLFHIFEHFEDRGEKFEFVEDSVLGLSDGGTIIEGVPTLVQTRTKYEW